MSSLRSSESSDSQSRALLNEKDIETLIHSYHNSRRTQWAKDFRLMVAVVLILGSIAANVYLVLDRHGLVDMIETLTTKTTAGSVQHERSKYAGLASDVLFPFEWATDWASADMSVAAPLWDSINFDNGMVALNYSWTESVGLPQAQKFPWDHDKGLYILNGYHNMHCLKSIHQSLREYMQNKTQTRSVMHIMHCMDSLRQDVLCHADDTPRYTTITKDPQSGMGQVRQCKDWTKLVEWARERNSCYRYIGPEADHINQFERFKFCPPDSPYWSQVRKHFNKPDDWYPRKGELAADPH